MAEEELSSRCSNGSDSETWETSVDEGRTKSKNKLLPDGFLDPLPPQKSSKLPRLAESSRSHSATPPQLHPSIAHLRGSHRAAHPESGCILEACSHMLMAREWPVSCPRMLEALSTAGLECLRYLDYIRLDQHLITAFVERWSPNTNTFHLPVGEMTITLQDLSMILGLRIDGPAFVGPRVVGMGHRWHSWPQLCDELIGSHPEKDIIYHNPERPWITSKFSMGQAKSQTCLPLRWIRWTYYRASYIDLDDIQFMWHVRAYILFILGTFLIPDTSGSEVHLQYLPLLEHLIEFSTYSLGGAVLGNLYRELREATRPGRTYMAGCLHLLQVWIWEHLPIGRPTLHVPIPKDIGGKCLGYRWIKNHVVEMRPSVLAIYRDMIEGLQQSQVTWEAYDAQFMLQVHELCTAGASIWLARVPLICWRRVEWYLPDRVMRQFGRIQRIDMQPMEDDFTRVDGRGKADVDWVQHYQHYIQLWDNREAVVIHSDEHQENSGRWLKRYMSWYTSWASLFLLKAPIEPPTTYYPKSPGERVLRNFFLEIEATLKSVAGREDDMQAQKSMITRLHKLCHDVRQSMHITDDRYVEEQQHHFGHTTPVAHSNTHDPQVSMAATSWSGGPFIFPSGPIRATPTPLGLGYYWLPQPHFSYLPQFVAQSPAEIVEPPPDLAPAHDLRERPRRASDHYTTETDAIPGKR